MLPFLSRKTSARKDSLQKKRILLVYQCWNDFLYECCAVKEKVKQAHKPHAPQLLDNVTQTHKTIQYRGITRKNPQIKTSCKYTHL